MPFTAISLEEYLKLHAVNNPNESKKKVRNKLLSSLKAFQQGVKCSCGQDIWVLGSAFVGNKCFTCITGEAFPADDYELEGAMDKNISDEKKSDFLPIEGGFYTDEGEKINPNLIKKPSLCVGCKKDGDPNQEILCTMTRYDQKDEDEFICYAFERI